MGAFSSSPIVVVAAVYSDMSNALERGPALTVFAVSVFIGPTAGPIVGSFNVTSYLGWRWDSDWFMIMDFTTFILIIFFLKETYPPTVLVTKAELLLPQTKNWAIHAKQEESRSIFARWLRRTCQGHYECYSPNPFLFSSGST